MYKLQNKYQDEGWKDLGCKEFRCIPDASHEARTCSNNSICYGMVRVVRKGTNEVMVTFPAGGGDPLSSVKPEQSKSKKEQDAVRDGFEKWMTTCCFDTTKHAGGGYNNHETDIWWEIWQAACKWKQDKIIQALDLAVKEFGEKENG